ncbi:unnamed protein product [Laminaria digitata]
MAYKDEYEVARLHVETGFEDRLGKEFSKGFKVSYHMAPPLLPLGKDGRGRPLKKEFGSWMRLPLSAMAKMKRLRGTTFDLFGYTSERRKERALIEWYEALLSECERLLTTETAEAWTAILGAPMDMRGYGPVKEKAVDDVMARVARQRAELASA